MSKIAPGNVVLSKFVQDHPRLVVVLAGVAAAALLLFGMAASPAEASEPQTVGPVTGLTATAAGQPDGTVRLNWNAAENAQVYVVLLLNMDDLQPGKSVNGQMRAFNEPQGTISGLQGGAEYYFIVQGMRVNWPFLNQALGDWSAPASATPSGLSVAPLPASTESEPETVGRVTGLTASADGQPPGTVHLTWNPVENAQVYFVSFLNIADARAGKGIKSEMRAFSEPLGTISGLQSGAEYYFIARGMRFNWTDFSEVLGDWSTVQSATPTLIPGRANLYQPIQPPMAPAYIDWRWDPGQGGFRELSTDFTIHNDVGDWSDQHGLYLILLQNDISGAGFYFGLQTDANGRGKGAIFSRWKTDDLANARWDGTDGWYELGRHEGGFLGVRRSYDWSAGDYRIRIAPDGLESDGEWFGLWITDLSTSQTTWIGSLKFPLKDGTATIKPHASATIELYGNPRIRPIDVPQWHVSVKRSLGDGVPATWGSTSYPWDASENALFNSDVRYDTSGDAAHLLVGGGTERTNAAVRRIDFKPLTPFADLRNGAWLEQDKPASANQLKALPWVANGVDDSERESVEWLILVAVFSLDAFDALMQIPWVLDSITPDEAVAIGHLSAMTHTSPDAFDALMQIPWVLDSITPDEAVAIDVLARIAHIAPDLFDALMQKPWVLDSITPDEAVVIGSLFWIANGGDASLRQEAIQKAIEIVGMPFLDSITPDEAVAIDVLARIAHIAPDLFDALMQKPWVLDSITPDEAVVIGSLFWIANGGDASLRQEAIQKAIEIVGMPFLDSLESPDVIAAQNLRGIWVDDSNGFLDIMAHPKVSDGITDQEAKVVAVLNSARHSTPASLPVLLDGLDGTGGVYLEERIIRMPLAGETLLTIIRLRDQTNWSMDLLEHAVRSAEAFMNEPFPVSYVAMYFADLGYTGGFNAGGLNIVVDDSFDVDEGHNWAADVGPSVIAHEIAHHYWQGGANWLDEGAAELVSFVSELERAGTPLETHLMQGCLHAKTLAESESIGPNPCDYYLGAKLFLDLYNTLGEDTFRQRFRDLYLKRLHDDPADDCDGIDLNICHVAAAFKSGASDDVAAKVDEVIARWYGPLP